MIWYDITLYIYIYIYIYASIHTEIDRYMHIHIIIHICMYLSISVCMCIYVYVYICIYIYIYVCVYTNSRGQAWIIFKDRRGGRYGWKTLIELKFLNSSYSSSNVSIRAIRVSPLIEIGSSSRRATLEPERMTSVTTPPRPHPTPGNITNI